MTQYTTRSYTELSQLPTFTSRFAYLQLNGLIGRSTFAHDRWMNQRFYTSAQWRTLRDYVIARDMGLDLGCDGYEIHDRVIIHHMNPMTIEDMVTDATHILDPEFLITVSHRTHNAIHYGDESLLPQPIVNRRPGDTDLWRPLKET